MLEVYCIVISLFVTSVRNLDVFSSYSAIIIEEHLFNDTYTGELEGFDILSLILFTYVPAIVSGCYPLFLIDFFVIKGINSLYGLYLQSFHLVMGISFLNISSVGKSESKLCCSTSANPEYDVTAARALKLKYLMPTLFDPSSHVQKIIGN